MENFFTYLLKSGAILSVFYVVYIIFLKKETFVRFNRHFLLGGIITAILLPFVKITKYVSTVANDLALANLVGSNDNLTQPIVVDNLFNREFIVTVFFSIYLIVVFALVVKIVFNVLSFYRFIKPFKREKVGDFFYVKTNLDISPFSFMKYIVFNPEKFSTKELENIINHEKEHSIQKHSYDIILVELIIAFQWINPIAWFYKKEIVQNLEYLADSKAFDKLNSPKEYQLTMLKSISDNKELAVSNNFYDSLIKKRIKMLNQKKSKTMKIFKSVAVLPLLVFFVFQFNTEIIAQTITLDGEVSQVATSHTPPDEYDYSINGEGGGVELKLKNSKALFIKDGKEISSEEATAINSKDILEVKVYRKDKGVKYFGDKAKEGVYVISTKKSNIQTVSTLQPIDSTKTNNSSDVGLSKTFKFTTSVPDPLYVIDGQIASKSDLSKLDKGKIKSMRVLKDKTATEKYGSKGLYGVVEIYVETEYVEPSVDKKKVDESYKVGLKAKNINASNSKSNFSFTLKDEPIIYIDGKLIKEKSLKNIKPDDIKEMKVWKGEEATKRFGSAGVNGVIEITTKKKGE